MQSTRVLIRCPRCDRHVGVEDVTCPFCQEPGPATRVRGLAPLAFAVIASAAAAASSMGCGAYGPPPRNTVDNTDSTTPSAPDPVDSAKAKNANPTLMAPAYGPPPPAPTPAPGPGDSPVGAYGPPPK